MRWWRERIKQFSTFPEVYSKARKSQMSFRKKAQHVCFTSLSVYLQESWSERKSGISYLIVFGSNSYVNVPNEKSKKVIFINYKTNSKRYKLYNPSNEKITLGYDVEFDEERTQEWEVLDENINYFHILKRKMNNIYWNNQQKNNKSLLHHLFHHR